MTGFQAQLSSDEKWEDIHARAIKDFPHRIDVMIPDKRRNMFLGMSEFREELFEWVTHHTTFDNIQWEAFYDGRFVFYFKEKDLAALFKLTYQ